MPAPTPGPRRPTAAGTVGPCPRCRRARGLPPPSRRRGRGPRLGRDGGRSRLHPPRRRAWHRRPAHRPHWRRVRARDPAQRRPAVGAAQRRRHRQGAMAGRPGRGAPAPLRAGPRAGVRRRGHLRSPRQPLRDHHPAPQRGALRRRGPARAVPGRPRAVHPRRGEARARPAGPAAEHLLLPRRDASTPADAPQRRVRRPRRPRRPCSPRCAWSSSSPTRRTRSTRRRTSPAPPGGARLALEPDDAVRPALDGRPRGPPRVRGHRRVPDPKGLS